MVTRTICLSSVILVVIGPACLTKEVADDGGLIDAGADTAVRETAPKLPPPQRKELGASCAAPSDCASAFCVDGVCCETACDGECVACNVSGITGRCTALDGVEDLSAVPPCTGTRVCAKDAAGISACRLEDGESCTQSTECASTFCRTYYRDGDSDGYGVDSADTMSRCDAVARPPQRFSATLGDCCDSDPGAHPGVDAYQTTRHACGSFDWNCSGAEEHQANGTCPSSGAAVLACGQACTLVLKGTASTLFIQACR